MKKDKIFRVTSPTDSVCEFFDCRQSAINFIVDEFALAITFRTETEGERLAEYMLTHNETPNQYPYKYLIEEVRINHEYDAPTQKSIYMVKIDWVKDCMTDNCQFLYYDYEKAREHYDSLVDEDIKRNGENPNVESIMNAYIYDRWYTNEGYCVDHCKIELIEFIEKNGELVEVEKK